MSSKNSRRRTLDASSAAAVSRNAASRRKLTSEPVTKAEALEASDDNVTASVPKSFTLTLDHHHVITYQQGAQLMPRDHAEHWWSQANGVTIVD